MMLSIAHAASDEPDAEFLMSAWSDIVVGDRPDGLVNCYLSRSDNQLYMISIWVSHEAHDRALENKATHPAFGFFEACGIDPEHQTLSVIGHLS